MGSGIPLVGPRHDTTRHDTTERGAGTTAIDRPRGFGRTHTDGVFS